jgi:DNA-binding beta-propeller fold protein YncE
MRYLPLLVLAPALLAQSNSDFALRALAEAAPRLPLQRTELSIDPPLAADQLVSSVAVDSHGNIYLVQRGVPNPVVVTDGKGKVLHSWGEGLFKLPHGIRVDPTGNVWTIDANSSMVYKFTPEGKKLLEISVGGQPAGKNQFVGTTDIAFAKNGHVYISDGYGNARVLEYDAAGHKIGEFGKPGQGPGEFHLPHGIAIGPDGNVYVADRENGRVQWFTPEGKQLGEWTLGGRIFSLAFDAKGGLYVGARQKDAATSVDGWLLKVDRATGKILGRVDAPVHSVAVAADGSLLTGTATGRVLVFRPAK